MIFAHQPITAPLVFVLFITIIAAAAILSADRLRRRAPIDSSKPTIIFLLAAVVLMWMLANVVALLGLTDSLPLKGLIVAAWLCMLAAPYTFSRAFNRPLIS